ncbi:CG0192-related protein [Mumia sp. Pv 4-285]|uniref:CG0192-related protein n=1 Tax=Mumia qirimensis TaxID=3234852 RepID=UPI00351D0584
MALIHRAELVPGKLDILSTWLPSQAWFPGGADGELERVGAYRFDDPAGEVGIETLLVRYPGGPVLQVPLTYRAAPLEGADDALVGTMHHSVLGERWAYDGTADPVYVQAVVAAIVRGGHQADEVVEADDGRLVTRELTTFAHGSGADVDVARTTIDVRRVLTDGIDAESERPALRGRWPGQDDDVVLVTA